MSLSLPVGQTGGPSVIDVVAGYIYPESLNSKHNAKKLSMKVQHGLLTTAFDNCRPKPLCTSRLLLSLTHFTTFSYHKNHVRELQINSES